MTAKKDKPLPFDIVAFALALVLAPIAVTAVSFFLLIPIFALVFGGPVYLVVGSPVLLWMVGRYPPEVFRFALAGIGSIIVLMALMGSLHVIRPDLGADEFFAFLIFGAIFAPLWAGTFAPLYRRFNRIARLAPQS